MITVRQIRRGAVLAALNAIFGRRGRAPLPNPSELRRVLLIRFDRIGDMIITTPVIEFLKQIAPQAEIDILASRSNSIIIAGDPRVARIFIWEGSPWKRWRTIREMRARGYDLAYQFILNRNTIPTIVASTATPNGAVIGQSSPEHERLMDFSFPLSWTDHFSRRTLDLTARGLGIELPSQELNYSIHLSAEDRETAAAILAANGIEPGGFIYLNVSAARDSRNLNPTQSAQLARKLHATTGLTVAIVGDPRHREEVERAAHEAGEGSRALHFRSLKQAIAGIECARLIITPDTSVVHIGSAMRRPVVALFTHKGDIPGWRPMGTEYEVVQPPSGDTLENLDLDGVVQAAQELLKRVRP